MKCHCGFDNETAAKFCGSCGLPLAKEAQNPRPVDPIAPAPAALPEGGRALAKQSSRPRIWLLALAIAAAAAGYWWLNQALTLSRETAKESLEVLVNREPWTAEFGTGPTGGAAAHNVSNVPALMLYLDGADLIADGTSSRCPIRLTDSGLKEYRASQWECRFSDVSCGGGEEWVDSCGIPVTSTLQVEVTGIRLDDATHAVVEYTVIGVPSRWGQTLQKLTQMAGGLPVIFPEMMEPQHSRAAFELYDDGWRVVNFRQ